MPSKSSGSPKRPVFGKPPVEPKPKPAKPPYTPRQQEHVDKIEREYALWQQHKDDPVDPRSSRIDQGKMYYGRYLDAKRAFERFNSDAYKRWHDAALASRKAQRSAEETDRLRLERWNADALAHARAEEERLGAASKRLNEARTPEEIEKASAQATLEEARSRLTQKELDAVERRVDAEMAKATEKGKAAFARQAKREAAKVAKEAAKPAARGRTPAVVHEHTARSAAARARVDTEQAPSTDIGTPVSAGPHHDAQQPVAQQDAILQRRIRKAAAQQAQQQSQQATPQATVVDAVPMSAPVSDSGDTSLARPPAPASNANQQYRRAPADKKNQEAALKTPKLKHHQVYANDRVQLLPHERANGTMSVARRTAVIVPVLKRLGYSESDAFDIAIDTPLNTATYNGDAVLHALEYAQAISGNQDPNSDMNSHAEGAKRVPMPAAALAALQQYQEQSQPGPQRVSQRVGRGVGSTVGRVIDRLARITQPARSTVGNLPVPGGIGGLFTLNLLFLFFAVPANAQGYTRAQLLWLTLLNRTKLPEAPPDVQIPASPLFMTAQNAARALDHTAIAITGLINDVNKAQAIANVITAPGQAVLSGLQAAGGVASAAGLGVLGLPWSFNEGQAPATSTSGSAPPPPPSPPPFSQSPATQSL